MSSNTLWIHTTTSRRVSLGIPLATAVGVVIATGFLLRFWLTLPFLKFPNAEAGAVARALAGGRGFSDPFYFGEGPTAHLMPVAPALNATTYVLFGGGWLGEMVRRTISYGVTCVCYALSALCCWRGGAKLQSIEVGIAFLFLVPVYAFDEMIRWQAWDGGLATALALAALARLLRSEHRPRGGDLAIHSILPAITFLVNPLFGVAVGAATFHSILNHRRQRGLLKPLILCIACACVVVGPWTVRNYVTFGRFIPSRDNLGLELAIANFPDAVAPANPLAAAQSRMRAVHPSENPLAQRRMRAAGGEVQYSEQLGENTFIWMAHHPQDVCRIWARHIGETLFPQPYMFQLTHVRSLLRLRTTSSALVSVFGLLSLS